MKKVASAVLLALAMGGAHAQVYIEGALGATNLDADCDGVVSCDNNDTGLKLIGGYKVNPNLAVEFGYLNFGKASARASTYFYGDTDITALWRCGAPGFGQRGHQN